MNQIIGENNQIVDLMVLLDNKSADHENYYYDGEHECLHKISIQ